jgi:hypothetical protein
MAEPGNTGAPNVDSAVQDRNRRELAQWRRWLLPVAIVVIFAGSAIFIWISNNQFADLKTSIEASSGGNDIPQVIAGFHTPPGDNGAIRDKVQLLMAERAQRANLSRASASLLLSLWTRNMGFVTGMILAMVGATFILSRLDDAGTQLSAEQGTLKGSLSTSSPGIVLAVLGTVLMVMAMSVRYTETGKDSTQAAAIPVDGQAQNGGQNGELITQTLPPDTPDATGNAGTAATRAPGP